MAENKGLGLDKERRIDFLAVALPIHWLYCRISSAVTPTIRPWSLGPTSISHPLAVGKCGDLSGQLVDAAKRLLKLMTGILSCQQPLC